MSAYCWLNVANFFAQSWSNFVLFGQIAIFIQKITNCVNLIKFLIQAQKSKGQNAKEPMKLTAIEKMLLDESDDSSDD